MKLVLFSKMLQDKSIDAVMEAEPAPESIVLNSSIEPVTRTINLRT